MAAVPHVQVLDELHAHAPAFSFSLARQRSAYLTDARLGITDVFLFCSDIELEDDSLIRALLGSEILVRVVRLKQQREIVHLVVSDRGIDVSVSVLQEVGDLAPFPPEKPCRLWRDRGRDLRELSVRPDWELV